MSREWADGMPKALSRIHVFADVLVTRVKTGGGGYVCVVGRDPLVDHVDGKK